MKKTAAITSTLLLFIAAISAFGSIDYDTTVIEKIKISNTEIPEGFMLGKIPGYAKKIFQANPWMMDTASIKKLSSRIYPGGNYNKIKHPCLILF